jgi:hypothetical protein
MSKSENLQTARRRQKEGALDGEKVELKTHSEQSALNIADESKPVEVGCCVCIVD